MHIKRFKLFSDNTKISLNAVCMDFSNFIWTVLFIHLILSNAACMSMEIHHSSLICELY